MRYFAALFLIALVSPLASAQEFKEAKVRTDIPKVAIERCQLSNASFTAQLETTLRSNGIKVENSARGPTFYFFLSVGEYGSDSCQGHGYLQVYSYANEVNLSWTKKRADGLLEHCLRTFSFYGGKGFEQQERLNSVLGDITRQCVSLMLKK